MPYNPVDLEFRKAPLAIATYAFSEVVDGTGIVQFFGCRISVDDDATEDKYIMTTKNMSPSASYTVLSAGQDLDFDVEFVVPKVINGTAFFTVPAHADNSLANPYVIVRKWDGSTETDIVAVTTMPNYGGASYPEMTLRVEIPRTTFKKGEFLRITVGLDAGANSNIDLYHDPLASQPLFEGTGGKMSMFIPFEVDI